MVGLLYGQRALMLGAMMHPLAYYGTSAHTAAKERPFQRLVHTAKGFEAIFFGTRAEADRVLAYVHRLHSAGQGHAGLETSARGPRERRTRPSTRRRCSGASSRRPSTPRRATYEALVRPLSGDEREGLWQDYIRFGELFGMPREAAPATYPEFRAAWDERIESKWVFLSDEAREVGYVTGYEIPSPRRNRPGMRALEQLLTGVLPERARELYGLRWSRRDRTAFNALARASRATRPLTPDPIRRGSCQYFYDLVAKTERRRIERGEPTPQVASVSLSTRVTVASRPEPLSQNPIRRIGGDLLAEFRSRGVVPARARPDSACRARRRFLRDPLLAAARLLRGVRPGLQHAPLPRALRLHARAGGEPLRPRLRTPTTSTGARATSAS